MFKSLFEKVFGSKAERDVKRNQPIVDEINDRFEEFGSLSDYELKSKTQQFRETIKTREDAGEEIQEILDDLLVDAFAVVKETCNRFKERKYAWDVAESMTTWDMVPFDVQLIGGIVLHEGAVAEMATGEGKTLVATLPLYLNALAGRGVHLVTVNDYLAKRDAMWMGPIFTWLGLELSVLQDERVAGSPSFIVDGTIEDGITLRPCTRKEAYAADITYGQQSLFGFDYLYDNMAIRVDDIRHRTVSLDKAKPLYYAVVDEADQLLIDEARTPLIISGPVADSNQHQYVALKPMVEQLVRKQVSVVNGLAEEGAKQWEAGETYQAGLKLLKVQRGAPKHRMLLRLVQNSDIKAQINRVEMDFIRDKKQHELDDGLLYYIEEKSHVAELTEEGRASLAPTDQDRFTLPDLSLQIQELDDDETLSEEERIEKREEVHRDYAEAASRIHSLSQLIRAYGLYQKDDEYVLENNQVVIVDEFTGRLQPGRRFSDGLHQALEAKENVKVERDTQTTATITVQNYFRMYEKLAGMTGTAETESTELFQIYKLDVVVVPTNQPVIRADLDDIIFRTRKEKFDAIIEEITALHEEGLPVLVGTRTVDVSELLSRMLTRANIRHNVLNARYHGQEADIISNAGQPGAVTIATNMAGRGTDIKLHPSVIRDDPDQPGGLQIIGSERHDARRIDRQLRGRSGRQGDPGETRFFLSLEDDLMRLFGSERIIKIMDRLGAKEGEVITSPMVTRAIDKAQKRVETNNFEIRKRLLEFDDEMNKQREVIYGRRRQALESEKVGDEIAEVVAEVIADIVAEHTADSEYPSDWDMAGLSAGLRGIFLADIEFSDDQLADLKPESLEDALQEKILIILDQRRDIFGDEGFTYLERAAMLSTIDDKWREHLYEIELMREGIYLRAYGQKDPVTEFKREAFSMFEEMILDIDREALRMIFRAQPVDERAMQARQAVVGRMQTRHDEIVPTTGGNIPQRGAKSAGGKPQGGPPPSQPVKVADKVGRNSPCPCGSGKKYKQCHGKAGAPPLSQVSGSGKKTA